jgi:hypothetical protein
MTEIATGIILGLTGFAIGVILIGVLIAVIINVFDLF